MKKFSMNREFIQNEALSNISFSLKMNGNQVMNNQIMNIQRTVNQRYLKSLIGLKVGHDKG